MTFSRRSVVWLGLAFWPLVAGCERGARAAGGGAIHHSHTNVIVLTFCTLRADHLGCYGYSRDTSPNIDRLAREGILFERTLVQAPWTRASVAAMVTGLYPRTLNIGEPKKYTEPRLLHDSFRTLAEILKDQGYFTVGITANAMLNEEFQFGQGYVVYHDTGAPWKRTKRLGVPRGEDLTHQLFDELTARSRGQPFFAHVVNVDVHDPRSEHYELRNTVPFEVGTPPTRVDQYDLRLRYADEQVGDLRQRLDSLGLHDTLIVINGDHGEGFQEGGRPGDEGHGGRLYNSAIWVPWVIYHPQLGVAGARRPELVQVVDLVPTVLDLLGIPFKGTEFNGVSRKNLILTGVAAQEQIGFTETQFKHANKSAVVTDAWKLIVAYSHGVKKKRPLPEPRYELYRYAEDRLEQQDQIDSYPAVASELRRRLSEWQAAHPPVVDESELVSRPSVETLKRLRDIGYADREPDDAEANDNVGTDEPEGSTNPGDDE